MAVGIQKRFIPGRQDYGRAGLRRLRKVKGGVPAAFLPARWASLSSPRSPKRLWSKGLKLSCSNIVSATFGAEGEEADFTLPKAKVVEVEPDFADIKGHVAAKRGMDIAAAGHHNLALIGAPGSGKTMLAKALRGILPPLSDEELIEVMRIRSARGASIEVERSRPFRPVHHTASVVALCGGGSDLRPGEISLAHRGVLFLDEITEFRRDVLEALRQPLEDGCITVSRAAGSVVYPASVLLVTASNPCPCGYLGDSARNCTCSPGDIERYSRKLSGPILTVLTFGCRYRGLRPMNCWNWMELAKVHSK